MGRHINLGNNFYLPFGSVSHQLLYILLCIESSDRRRFSRFRIAPEIERNIHTVDPPGSCFRQTGIFLDFQPPAVVIRQMKMESIDFEHRHTIDDTQNVLFRNKESGDIQHQCPITKAWFILNSHCGNIPVKALCPLIAFDSRWQQ